MSRIIAVAHMLFGVASRGARTISIVENLRQFNNALITDFNGETIQVKTWPN